MYPALTRLKSSYGAPLASILLAFAATAAFAQPAGGKPPSGERRGPPAEALTACKSLNSGDACSFTSPRGEVSGSCAAPEGKPLACRPKDAPSEGGNSRPAKN